MDAPGNLTLLHPITDSGQPVAGLIQATDGLFYGTTNGPLGTVFRIDAAGSYAVINRLDGTDGFGLNERLLQVNDPLFYGTVPEDGLLDIPAGELFRLGSAGNVRVLHSFAQSNATANIIPNAQLVQGADGALYGATGFGGSGGHGTIFRLDLTMPTPPHLQLRRAR